MLRRLFDKINELPPDQQRWLIAGAFIAGQAFIWFVLFETLWYGDRSISDLPVYYTYAGRMAQGMMPYRDFALEYPPVAMLLFSLPRFISGPPYDTFVKLFEIEMFAFNCGITVLLSIAAWKMWRSRKKLAGVLGVYTFFLLALGSIVELRFDLAAAFIILASLVCFITDRYLFAWLLIGIGFMTKEVPALLAPLFLIIHWRRRQLGELWMGPLAAALAALIVSLPFLIASPTGLANAFLYHVERPLQIESSWSSPLLLAGRFGGFSLRIMNAYGSHNVYSSLSNTFVTLSTPVTALLLIGGYILFYRWGDSGGEAREGLAGGWGAAQLPRFALVAVGAFIFAGKVFSPQFLIWVIPLVALVKGAGRRWVIGLFAGVLILTQIEFPFNYWRLLELNAAVVSLVSIRNILLGATLVFTLVSLVKKARGRESGEHTHP